MVLMLAACSMPRWPFSAPAVSELVPAPARKPVISSGRAGLPILPADPNVYADDEGLHLFYSTFFCRRGSSYQYSWDPEQPADCDIMGAPTAIAYAFSADRGRTWVFRNSPVISPGDAGFDSLGIETAAVFRMHDALYMAYSAAGRNSEGKPWAARFQIGLARLPLGTRSVREAMMDETVRFERRPSPLLPYDLRPRRFDNNVQEPSVVIGPNGIELFFVGLGLELPDQPIDAPGQKITSVALGRARLDNELNLVSRRDSPVLYGVNIAEVRYFANAYHLFGTTLTAGEAHRGEALVHAMSVNGIRWSAPQPLLSPGSTREFDDWGLMAPTFAADRHGLVLFYTALGTSSRRCRPVGPGARFGSPVANGRRCMFATVGRMETPMSGSGSSTSAGY